MPSHGVGLSQVRMSDPKAPPRWQELEAAGRELGVNVVAENVSTPDDLDGVFQALARQRVDVLIVLQTSMLISERRKIASSFTCPATQSGLAQLKM